MFLAATGLFRWTGPIKRGGIYYTLPIVHLVNLFSCRSIFEDPFKSDRLPCTIAQAVPRRNAQQNPNLNPNPNPTPTAANRSKPSPVTNEATIIVTTDVPTPSSPSLKQHISHQRDISPRAHAPAVAPLPAPLPLPQSTTVSLLLLLLLLPPPPLDPTPGRETRTTMPRRENKTTWSSSTISAGQTVREHGTRVLEIPSRTPIAMVSQPLKHPLFSKMFSYPRTRKSLPSPTSPAIRPADTFVQEHLRTRVSILPPTWCSSSNS